MPQINKPKSQNHKFCYSNHFNSQNKYLKFVVIVHQTNNISDKTTSIFLTEQWTSEIIEICILNECSLLLLNQWRHISGHSVSFHVRKAQTSLSVPLASLFTKQANDYSRQDKELICFSSVFSSFYRGIPLTLIFEQIFLLVLHSWNSILDNATLCTGFGTALGFVYNKAIMFIDFSVDVIRLQEWSSSWTLKHRPYVCVIFYGIFRSICPWRDIDVACPCALCFFHFLRLPNVNQSSSDKLLCIIFGPFLARFVEFEFIFDI